MDAGELALLLEGVDPRHAHIEQEERAARERGRQKRPRARGWHVRRAKRQVHQVALAPE
jgi:hypothetical protein